MAHIIENSRCANIYNLLAKGGFTVHKVNVTHVKLWAV